MVRRFSKIGGVITCPLFFVNKAVEAFGEDCCLSRGPTCVNRHLCLVVLKKNPMNLPQTRQKKNKLISHRRKGDDDNFLIKVCLYYQQQ